MHEVRITRERELRLPLQVEEMKRPKEPVLNVHGGDGVEASTLFLAKRFERAHRMVCEELKPFHVGLREMSRQEDVIRRVGVQVGAHPEQLHQHLGDKVEVRVVCVLHVDQKRVRLEQAGATRRGVHKMTAILSSKPPFPSPKPPLFSCGLPRAPGRVPEVDVIVRNAYFIAALLLGGVQHRTVKPAHRPHPSMVWSVTIGVWVGWKEGNVQC